jgi:predicted site-specific integrase-resolvase
MLDFSHEVEPIRETTRRVIRGYQAPSGTIIVEAETKLSAREDRVGIYARVSSAEHKENLERQVERLVQYL